MRFLRSRTPLQLALALCALSGVHVASGQSGSVRGKSAAAPPVALSVLPSGALLILHDDGAVFSAQQGRPGARPLRQSDARFVAMDMTVYEGVAPASVFITLWQRNNQAYLLQFTEQGKEARRWALGPGTYVGTAFDPTTNTLFLVNSSQSEIRSLSLKRPGEIPKYVTRVADSDALGPVAVDVRRKHLYVGDAVKGVVFDVDLAKKRTRVLVSSLGEPAALVYDAQADKLYVADAGRKRVVVGTPSPDAVFTPIVTTQAFIEPRGLALDRSRNLWVADAGANKVFLLSASGRVVQTVP